MKTLKCRGKVYVSIEGKRVECRYLYNPSDSSVGIHDLFTTQELKLADADKREAISLALNPGDLIDLYVHYDAQTIESSLRRGGYGWGGLASYLLSDPPMLQLVTEDEFRKLTVDSLSKGATSTLAEKVKEYDGSIQAETIEFDSPTVYSEGLEAHSLTIDIENARDKTEEREVVEKAKQRVGELAKLKAEGQAKIDAVKERRGEKHKRLGPNAASDGILETSDVHTEPDEVVYIPESDTEFIGDDITVLKGIGPVIAKKLATIDIHSIQDLSAADSQILVGLGFSEEKSKEFIDLAKSY